MINYTPWPNGIQFPWLEKPYQTSAVSTQTYQQNIPSVNGIDAARTLNIGKNATTLMLDTNQNVIYVKSTDGIGAITSFAAFEMKQIDLSNASNTNADDRMTRMENDIAEIKKLLNDRRCNNGKQYSSDDRKQKQQS